MTLLVLKEAGCTLASLTFGSLAHVNQRFDEEVKKNHRQDAPCITYNAGFLVLMSGADYYRLRLYCHRECVMGRSHRKLLFISLDQIFVLAVHLS